MKVLDRLPYAEARTTVTVRGEAVRVRAYQIVLWVSISIRGMLEWDRRTPWLPAILDTGNNYNFSIGRGQLLRWAGIRPEVLEQRGAIRERGLRVPVHAAKLWLHPNPPGRQQTADDENNEPNPYALNIKGGIAIYPDEAAPRLPVLGLRALTENRLYLTVDSDRRLVSLRTMDWRTKLLRLLRLLP